MTNCAVCLKTLTFVDFFNLSSIFFLLTREKNFIRTKYFTIFISKAGCFLKTSLITLPIGSRHLFKDCPLKISKSSFVFLHMSTISSDGCMSFFSPFIHIQLFFSLISSAEHNLNFQHIAPTIYSNISLSASGV